MKILSSIVVAGLLVTLAAPSIAWAKGGSSASHDTHAKSSSGAQADSKGGAPAYPHATPASIPFGLKVPKDAKIYSTSDDAGKVNDWFNSHASAEQRATLTVQSFMGKTYIIEG